MFQLQISQKNLRISNQFRLKSNWKKIYCQSPKSALKCLHWKLEKKIWKKKCWNFFLREKQQNNFNCNWLRLQANWIGKANILFWSFLFNFFFSVSDLFCSVSDSVSVLFVQFLLLSLFLNLFLSFNKRSTHHFIYFAWLKHEFEDFAKILFVKRDLQGTNHTIFIG